MANTTIRIAMSAAAALIAACAQVDKVIPDLAMPRMGPSVPDNLKPPAGERRYLEAAAKGVQIYECRAGAGGAPAWAFVAPEADLFDINGHALGRHYAGPTWELRDGSKTLGAVKERADAPAPNSIPWLLLDAKPVGDTGMLGKTTHIQRVSTVGGIAPESGCNAASTGKQERVYYTATYFFFTTAPR